MSEALRILDPEALAVNADDDASPAAPALMTSAELAGELQISERTVRRLEITGKIGPRPIHIGRAVRYRREEVTRWLEASCPDRENWAGNRIRRRH